MQRHAMNSMQTSTVITTIGGGLGKYRNVHGDVPTCIAQAIRHSKGRVIDADSDDVHAGCDKMHDDYGTTHYQCDHTTDDHTTDATTQHVPLPQMTPPLQIRLPTCNATEQSQPTNTTNGPDSQPVQDPTTNTYNFTLIHKNARSLTTDDSIEEMLTELDGKHWDVIAINETWRQQPNEMWITKNRQHVFAGSGHNSNNRGVAFMIHNRWRQHIQQFTPVDERIAYIDINITSMKFRLITAYFPHSGYGDAHVQRMYDTISTIKREAKQRKRHVILTGDFNAQVGSRMEDESRTTVGRFGMETCNSRGEWLKSWAGSEHFVIANTHFRKRPEFITTYIGPNGNARQIDYILVTTGLWRLVMDAHSTTCPDLGSDHRAVQLRLNLTLQPERRQKTDTDDKKTRPMKTSTALKWPPNNSNKYSDDLMQQLQDLTLTHDLDKRCKQIEDALLIATQLNQPTNVQQNMHNHNDRLFDLTRQRQQLPPNARTERKSISKSIQKEIKAIRRMEQRSKIDAIIRQYRGLKKISGIKSSKDKDLITNMTNDSGKDVTKRQSIADVFATFYERLYTEQMQPNDADHTDNDDETHHDDDDTSVIDDFSDEELQTAITQLRSGRCKDKSGIMAEMIKTGGEPIRRHLLLLYNDIKRPHAQPPTQWKQTTITVIYKAGDPKLPQNYRPIAIIPLLYKLFSRLIYNRLEPMLNALQSCDQAGFRRNFCTEDLCDSVLGGPPPEGDGCFWTDNDCDDQDPCTSDSCDQLAQLCENTPIPDCVP